ncbi:MAG: Gfo/Idh/MocA family oxidoreductase [Patescibacteria group bacterium]
MKKLNFALVGCGRIADTKHAPILANEIKEANLVAVCDIKLNRAEELGKKYNVPYYTGYHEMAKKHPEIDVFNVLTESGNHAAHTIDLSRYGKHIVVEKPIALKINDADKMIDSCRKNKCRLFVVKQNRYNYPISKLKEAIKQKRFGKIFLATVRVRWCRHQDYYDMDEWRGTWKMDGGVFSQQASHHLDLLEWLVGETESVFARSTNAFAKIEAEDTGIVSLKFKNGTLGLIEATTATRPTNIEGSISILGSRGTAEVGGFAANEMRVWQFEDKEQGDEDALIRYKTSPPSVYGFGHAQYLKDVVDAIINKKKAFVDGNEGRKALRLIHAIYKSIETRKEVFLNNDPESSRLGRGQK